MSAPTTFDLAVAEATAICEASSAGSTAMFAVVWSLINRSRLGAAYAALHGGAPHPLFGSGHMSEAALDPEQYSTFNRDQGDWHNLRRRCVMADDDPTVVEAARLVTLATSGTAADPTRGATHYYDESIPPPSWTVGATPTLVVGRLHFFADVP